MTLTSVLGIQPASLLPQEALPAAGGWSPLTVALVCSIAGVIVGAAAWAVLGARLTAWRTQGRTPEAKSDRQALAKLKRQQEELAFRHEQLQNERAVLENRRRVLSETNEMLAMQKSELEERTELLARANQELERMEQLNAWQQEELSERNTALERQTTEAERLSGELARRVAELDDAMRQIDRMYREQEAFLRHELGNAIVPIQGYSEMLLMGADLDEKVRERVGMIRSASKRMVELLTALRDLQAIERGDRPVIRARVDLCVMLEEAIQTSDPGNTESVETTLEPIEIRGDPALLPGVFLNLVRNAVEHVAGDRDHKTDGESSNATLPRTTSPVSVTLTRDDGFAVTRIVNGGPPIPADRLGSFFDRFNSTKPGGTGLGTSYARLVVEAHGGQIGVTSDEESGTVITVRLPVDAPAN